MGRIAHNKKTTEEFCKEVNILTNNEYEVLEEYKDSHTKILMKHKNCGYEWYVAPTDFLGGKRCSVCCGRIRNNESFIYKLKLLVNEEYTPLSKYKSKNEKMKMAHNICGHQWMVKPYVFLNNPRCPICNIPDIQKPKTNEEFMSEINDILRKGFAILSEYKNANTKIKIKHVCSDGFVYEWSVLPSKILDGIKCPRCETKSIKDKTTDYFKGEVFNLVKYEYEVLDEYKHAQVKIRFKHNSEICNKHIFLMTPDAFLRGQRCPICKNINNQGENNANWKGGTTPICNYLRDKISKWKLDSMKKYNYKCALTKIYDHSIQIHHVKSFSSIVEETMLTLNMPLRKIISDYTEEELLKIEETCIDLHYKYGLGIPLLSVVHSLFHHEYGQDGTTTKEEIQEFEKRFNSGEFNDILKI